MQIHRLFEIVYLLIERKTMTAKQLAEHFEVSSRTIHRDIDVLCEAGIPLYTTRGKGGGISLMDGYVLSKALFSENEQTGILAALQQLSATQYPQALSVISKMKGIFLKQTVDWLEVDFTHWGGGSVDKAKLDIIQSAVLHQQALEITYSNAGGETTRRVIYPLKLRFKSMAWYVSAFCTTRQDYRTFKLSRLRDPVLVDQFFGDMNLQAPPADIPETPHPLTQMSLLFHARQAHRVYDEFNPEQIAPRKDGYLLVHAALPMEPWLFSYLFTFGPDLEVLEPPEVRARLAGLAEAVVHKYH